MPKLHMFDEVDVRVRILVMILVSLSALMLKTETALLMCLVLLWIWIIPFGCFGKALHCTLAYGILYVLMMKNTDLFGNLPLLTVYIRRLVLPVMAAAPIIQAPTGSLIAALNKMKIPRAATLSLTVLFRFMPMLAEEYHHIRESQKIRGIGDSAVING